MRAIVCRLHGLGDGHHAHSTVLRVTRLTLQGVISMLRRNLRGVIIEVAFGTSLTGMGFKSFGLEQPAVAGLFGAVPPNPTGSWGLAVAEWNYLNQARVVHYYQTGTTHSPTCSAPA